MKLSFVAALLLLCASLGAQTDPRFYQPLGQVKDFLQLSDGQVQTILTNNDEYNRWASEKQSRIGQVQSEIAEETAKDPLEPSALGVRHAEVETICREMKDRAQENRSRNLAVLTQDQTAKLKVLEEAMNLAPTISQAQSGNLIGGLSYVPLFFTSNSGPFGMTGSVIGGIIGPANGCRAPVPTAAFRFGNFSSTARGTAVTRPGGIVGAGAASPASRWFETHAFATVNSATPVPSNREAGAAAANQSK